MFLYINSQWYKSRKIELNKNFEKASKTHAKHNNNLKMILLTILKRFRLQYTVKQIRFEDKYFLFVGLPCQTLDRY